MKFSKIPKHIWFGLLIPIVLVGLGSWRMYPVYKSYKDRDARDVDLALQSISAVNDMRTWSYGTVHPYWTGDVLGVYTLTGKRSGFVKLLSEADVAPLAPLPHDPVPYHGYFFLALDRDNSTIPPEEYRKVEDKSGRKVLNHDRFGFCAFPSEYDWRHRLTFIVNEDDVVYGIDNGGKPVTEWPPDEELAERFIKTGW